MIDLGALKDRLNDLENRIGAARDRLALNETLHHEHAATLDELTEHYLRLQQQLHSETVNLEAQGVHVDSFEKTVLNWINGLALRH